MEETALISVIVPVYKVEAYLDRCVQSIVDQTYRNLEIILVDDGSPDNCGAMCDAWAEKDSRIKVIHKENGGLSDARNAGMAIATGEYMGFVDSDDYIAPEMYQMLYDRMQFDGSDIAACGVEMVFEDGIPSQILTRSGSYILDKRAAMEAIVRESKLKHPVWNRLYKTDLISAILFPYKKYHEDAFWSYQAIASAENISVLEEIGYFYYQRNTSIMGQAYSEKRLDLIEAYWDEMMFVKKHHSDIFSTAIMLFGFRLLYAFQCILRMENEIERQGCILKIMPYLSEWKKYSHLGKTENIKQRMWYMLANENMLLAASLRNLLKVGI